jgi:hypothetical protein
VGGPWKLEYPPNLGKTTARGNSYNPFTLWLLRPQSSMVLPPLGDPLRQGQPDHKKLSKTLRVPRNLVRTVGLQRIWVP